MKYFLLITLLLIAFSALSVFGAVTPGQLQEKAHTVLNDLQVKATQLKDFDREDAFFMLRRLERMLSYIPDIHPFKLRLDGTTLTIYSTDNKKIYTWYKHDKYEIKGNVIALLDFTQEFAAFRADGVALVEKWKGVDQYWFMYGYIGLLDKDNIFEAYSTTSDAKKVFISNWRDTIKVICKQNYIALLDKDGIFEGFTLDGTKVARVTGVVDIEAIDERSVRYTYKNGKTGEIPIVQD